MVEEVVVFEECPGCCSKIGELHMLGCEVERCPRCGLQMQGCGCAVDFIRDGDRADEGEQRWWAEVEPRRMVWSGEWPGVRECHEWGWFARLVPGQTRWVPCGPTDEGATEDLNRLYGSGEARWNRETRRWERVSGQGT